MKLTKKITELLEKYDIEAKLLGTRFTCCLTSYVGKINNADVTFSETGVDGSPHIFKIFFIYNESDLAELENFLKGAGHDFSN